MQAFTLTDLSRRSGEVLAAALERPVALTRHRRPCFVVMSATHYESVVSGGGGTQPVSTSAEEPTVVDSPSQPSLF